MAGFFGSLFGGGDKPAPIPQRFAASTPAFNLSSLVDPTTGAVSTSFERRGSAAQLAQAERFPRVLGDIDRLRGLVTPGFSQMREGRLRQVESARSRAIGSLRENLSRRRVLGSSFGEDALARVEAEFGEIKSRQEAQSFLEEMATTTQLIQIETEQINTVLGREFQELGLSANFSLGISDLVSQNARFAQELASKEAAARGAFAGKTLGTLGAIAGGALGGAIGGPPGAVIGAQLGRTAGGVAGASFG
jgi:hypothetical protein